MRRHADGLVLEEWEQFHPAVLGDLVGEDRDVGGPSDPLGERVRVPSDETNPPSADPGRGPLGGAIEPLVVGLAADGDTGVPQRGEDTLGELNRVREGE